VGATGVAGGLPEAKGKDEGYLVRTDGQPQAKHLYRMNRAIVDALVSMGKIAAEHADK
jgi:hypothetical protein